MSACVWKACTAVIAMNSDMVAVYWLLYSKPQSLDRSTVRSLGVTTADVCSVTVVTRRSTQAQSRDVREP